MQPGNWAESNALSAVQLAQRVQAESKGGTPTALFFVYILRCCDGSYYVGSTSDLDARIHAHNNGDGAAWTKCRRPVTLDYQPPKEGD